MPKRYQRRAGKPNSVRGFCDEMTKNNIINSAAKIAAKQSSGEKEAQIPSRPWKASILAPIEFALFAT